MIYRFNDVHDMLNGPKKASTAFTSGSVVYFDTNGYLAPAVAASANVAGVCNATIATDDPNYALTTDLVYDQPRPGDQFIIDVTGGTPAQANIDKFYDLSDANTLNLGAAGTVKHFKFIKPVGTTQAVVQFNPAVTYST